MARRLEVELTSDKGDGTLTWRAAGAREPRGILDSSLLPEGVGVGDTVKVDAEQDIDGVTVTAVLPPPARRDEPDRLEVIGPPTGPARPPEARGGADRKARRRRERPEGPPRPARPEKPKLPPRPKPPRLRAGRAHRDALLSELSEEQRPVAEQVLKGGIPAVRSAIEAQNAEAEASGSPPVDADRVLALAEGLLPRLRVADWRDRAAAAVDQVETVDLRDLRSVVTKAESAARDPESRQLAERLREGLAARLEKDHAAWLAELDELLDDDRVVRALNVSSRPPKAGTPLPRPLAERLAGAAGQALNAEIGAKRWITVLEALALSPVHSQVEPASVPSSPSDELLDVVRRVSMQVPQVAARFGIEPTPPPRRRRAAGGGGGRQGARRQSRSASTSRG